MIIDEFFQKYNGKGVDFDGFYGYQCMDLYQQYNKEVISGPHLPANAYQVWNNFPRDLYTKIENTPEGVPQLGDVIIWNKNTGGGYGHIAVFKEGNANSFLSFDQNWPVGSICHFQNHNYTNVLGWLRPNPAIITQPIAQELTDQTLLDMGRYGWLEIQAIRGKLGDLELMNKLIGERDVTIADLTAKLASLTLHNPPETPPIEQEPLVAPIIQDIITWLKNLFVKRL